MKVALVASSYPPGRGDIGRHVDRLAQGLARRGVDVEIFGPGGVQGTERLLDGDGVMFRRAPPEDGSLRAAVTPQMWRALRFAGDAFDVVDVHTARIPLSFAVGHIGCRRLVTTPHAPLHGLLAWPYSRAIRTLVQASDSILCASEAERDILCRTFPSVAVKADVLRAGVDAAAIAAATPYAMRGKVIVATGRLDRHRATQRAIAAMASLDRAFRLVIVGDGPERRRLQAYAADQQVADRVAMAGPAPDEGLYRWLRTACVVVALAEEESSGLHLVEALAAGAWVVASDIPVHREIAREVNAGKVIFVSTGGSPLEVADAIAEAAVASELGTPLSPPVSTPTWESVVDQVWNVYRSLTSDRPAVNRVGDEAGVVPVGCRGS
jgi:glycosyltransferase involved in cell wall biosynthesis